MVGTPRDGPPGLAKAKKCLAEITGGARWHNELPEAMRVLERGFTAAPAHRDQASNPGHLLVYEKLYVVRDNLAATPTALSTLKSATSYSSRSPWIVAMSPLPLIIP